LYVLAGKSVFHYNTVGAYRYTVAGPGRLSPGKHTILIDFKYDGGLGKGGTATLMVDGKQIAQGKIERTIPFRISADETLDIGEDTGTPVSEDYQVPFKFTGDLKMPSNCQTPCSPLRKRRNQEDQGRNRNEQITHAHGMIGFARLVQIPGDAADPD
jgi:hypothetical protein